MFDTVYLLFHGGLGGACHGGNLTQGLAIEIEEEQTLLVVVELVDEAVERPAAGVRFGAPSAPPR